MTKQIRPLTAYKKENPDLYRFFLDPIEKGVKRSKKQQENDFYWNYCFFNSDLYQSYGNIYSESRKSNPAFQFFFIDDNDKNHIATITELGRLMLTGWYYGIEEFTKEIVSHVYRGYLKINGHGKQVNDREFAEAVKHIRENIICYYDNRNELKIYLLDKFFNEEIKALLPEQPDEVQFYEWFIKVTDNEKKQNEKQDKDYYYKLADLQEGYIEYLIDLLDSHNIGYFSIEQYKHNQQLEWEKRRQKIIQAYEDYEEQKRKALISSRLLT